MSRATRIAAEPRAGLSTGDVIAFTTVDDGHPYVVSRAADEDGRDDDGVFLFAPDASLLPASASEAKRHDALRGAADAHLEVQRHDEFWGFRAAVAHGRLLQATRKGACRLRFHGQHFGTWEEWLLDARSRSAVAEPWTRAEVIFRHRRLERLELKVALVRIGVSEDLVTMSSPAKNRPGLLQDGMADSGVARLGRFVDAAADGLDGGFVSPSRRDHPPGTSGRRSARKGGLAAIGSTRAAGALEVRPGSSRRPRRSNAAEFGAGFATGGARSRGPPGSSSAVRGGDAAREHTSVLHSMSGVVAKEFTVALRREVAARAAVEKEVLEMHAASEELRAWTLQELERLRAYARSTVDELGEELRDARIAPRGRRRASRRSRRP